MVTHYAPFLLLVKLNAMPQYYHSRIAQFYDMMPITAQQHIDKMNHYLDLQ